MMGNIGHIQLIELCLVHNFSLYYISSNRPCENLTWILNKTCYLPFFMENVLKSVGNFKVLYSNETEFVEHCFVKTDSPRKLDD